MAVGKLGRVADGLGGHGLDAGLVGLAVGLVGEHDAEAELGKERVPERVVLVHVERARDADGAARGLVGVEHRAVEEKLVLVLKEVRRVVLCALAAAGALLAAVAGDEATAAAEVVDREQAVVRAAPAVDVGVLDLQVVDLVAGKKPGGALLTRAVAGKKRRAVGAHAARHVGADHVATGQELEGAQRGVGHEGAALDYAVLSDLVEVAQLDYLKEGVLDDGVRKAGGHVADGRALLLGLLDAGVHKDGAAAAQIHGRRGAHGRLGELLDAHVHGHGEGLDEGAAARRARLVEHDVLDDAVLDLQALHVLAADVQDELDAGDEGLRAAQMRDGLDLAGVGAQGLDEDLLAVAGGGHVADHAVGGHLVVDVVGDGARGAQDVAVVVAVPGVKKLAVLADDGRLHGGGAGVDTDEHAAVVGGQVALGNDLLVVALLELAVVVLGGKEWLQALDLGALGVLEVLEQADDLGEGHVLIGLAGERRARGHKQVGVVGHDDVLVVEVQRDVEAVAQLGEVLQRAAEEGDVAADGVAAGEARDGLVGHGLEDGGGHVLGARALVEQGLDVRLCKDAAAAGDGVDARGALGELV